MSHVESVDQPGWLVLVRPKERAVEIDIQDWTENLKETPEIAQPKNLKEKSGQGELDTKYQMNGEDFFALLRKAVLRRSTKRIEKFIRLH